MKACTRKITRMSHMNTLAHPIAAMLLLFALPLVTTPSGAKEPSVGKKRWSTAIGAANAKQVGEYLNLQRKSFEVHWRPDGKSLAIIQWRQPVRFVSRSMFTDVPNEEIAKRATHFAFSPVTGVFAYNDGHHVTIVNRVKSTKIDINAGGDQPKIAFSPDGNHIVTSRYGVEATMWSVADGARVRTFKVNGSKGGLTTKFSPNGKILVVGNRNDTTHLFEATTGKLLRVLEKRMSHKFDFSPDGGTLAVAYVDGTIGLWEVATGKLLRTVNCRGKEAFTVCWSPKGDILASGGLNAPIVLWSTKDLSILRSLPAPERVFYLAFSPDGSLLATAGNTATQVWGLVD
jgi:WD40 repeat protein